MTISKDQYTPEQWARACILHWGSSEAAATKKANHAVPVKKPDGTPDPELMRAAVGALANSGAMQDQVRDAARVLMRLFDQIDDNPPDSLKGLAGRVARDFSGAGEDPGVLSLAEIERRIDALHGERCYDANGALDSSKVQEFAYSKGITYPEAERRLRGLDFTDGEREDVIVADLADELVAREERQGRELDYTTALIEVMRGRVERETEASDDAVTTLGASTEDGEDVRIADLADAYAEENGVDYTTALIEVQHREGR